MDSSTDQVRRVLPYTQHLAPNTQHPAPKDQVTRALARIDLDSQGCEHMLGGCAA